MTFGRRDAHEAVRHLRERLGLSRVLVVGVPPFEGCASDVVFNIWESVDDGSAVFSARLREAVEQAVLTELVVEEMLRDMLAERGVPEESISKALDAFKDFLDQVSDEGKEDCGEERDTAVFRFFSPQEN